MRLEIVQDESCENPRETYGVFEDGNASLTFHQNRDLVEAASQRQLELGL